MAPILWQLEKNKDFFEMMKIENKIIEDKLKEIASLSTQILGANSSTVGNWARLTLGILFILEVNSSADKD